MKLQATLIAAASALSLLATATSASASPTLTFKDGANTYTVDPFGGFDYVSNASAISTLPVYDGTTVMTTTYLASAIGVYQGAGVANLPGLMPPGGAFEFTVKATITETATCISMGVGFCEVAKFTATGGTWEVFYDQNPNANRDLGTGYVDGTRILAGNILPGVAGSFTAISSTTGSGNFSFFGDVTFTETNNTKDAWIDPALANTVAGAEIKIGNLTTNNWVAPTGWTDGGGFPTGGYIAFQADGNQSVSGVAPEPATLALVGLSLLGLGVARRKAK